jgi:response regulator of citrate/malate metabolism
MFSVVIVEDDYMVAELHRRLVDQLDEFRVVGVASTADQALKLVRSQKTDLLLLDLYLPGKNGLELLKELHLLDKDIDVIVITAGKEPSSVETALRRGVFDYLVKPFRPERLFQSLKRYEAFRRRVDDETKPLDQRDIDHLLAERGAPLPGRDLPKGVDPVTLERIRHIVYTLDEPQSAEQIGAAAGVSRTTARRYLEFLVHSGDVRLYLKYGQVGRPERLYGRTK